MEAHGFVPGPAYDRRSILPGHKRRRRIFRKVGSFEKGYEFDAVVLDDSTLRHPQELSVRERLERIIYLGDDRHIAAKYIGGRQVMSRELTCVSGKD